MDFRKFEGKNVLITGASSGIGEAMALLLTCTSANLFLLGRNRERLMAVHNKCDEIRNNSSENTNALDCSIQQFEVDFSDIKSIDAFVSVVMKNSISFDYIILNAGISQRAPTLKTDFSVDRKIMETNFFGPVYLIKKLSGMLLTGKPVHIAVTSSITGLFGFPLRSAYSASKHALFGFFESLELENKHIKVTFLIPGRINTSVSVNAVTGDGTNYAKMDDGQAAGMDASKCARIALRAIQKGKHRKLIGGKDLLMVHLKKFVPFLFYVLARKVSAT